MRTMKNLRTSLEPLQILRLRYQHYLFIKDQQQFIKDWLPRATLDKDSEYSDEYSAQREDSEKTLFYPDLYVLTDDEHWTMTPETHKCAAAAGTFCFVTTEKGDKQNICNLIIMPFVQRSWYLNEVTNNLGNTTVKFQRELTVEPETCWNFERLPAEEMQEQEPK